MMMMMTNDRKPAVQKIILCVGCLILNYLMVRSVYLIPKHEYERLLLKVTPARILMLSEYKGEFEHRLRSKCCRCVFLDSKYLQSEKYRGCSVYSCSRIASTERTFSERKHKRKADACLHQPTGLAVTTRMRTKTSLGQ